MAYVFRVVTPTAGLPGQPGDVLVWQPGHDVPYVWCQAVEVDPGTLFAAELAGALEVVTPPAVPVLRLVPSDAPPAPPVAPPWDRRPGVA